MHVLQYLKSHLGTHGGTIVQKFEWLGTHLGDATVSEESTLARHGWENSLVWIRKPISGLPWAPLTKIEDN